MRAALLLGLAGTACARPGLLPPGTAFERLDRRGLFHECIAQLAERGIPVVPPPQLVSSEKQIGLSAYQPVSKRVLVPPRTGPAARPGEGLLRTAAELMTGGRWDWRRYARDERTADLMYRFHLFGIIYQGVLQHLQDEGLIRPGRLDDEHRYDAERIASRARIAFLRHYVERVEPRLRPLYDLYERALRDLRRELDPKLVPVATQPPDAARRYWREQGRWMQEARSGQRTRAAFYIAWMVEDFDTVEATAHVRELADLRVRK